MRILVTGGAGFIASNVADAFINEGHEVAIVDNLSTGLAENLNPKARFYQVDMRDAEALGKVFAEFQPEAIDHHAAQIDVRKSTDDPVFDAQTNILGSLNLLRLAVKQGVRKIVYASTGGAIYGEPAYLPADEQHPVRPLCEYGISKHTVEHYLYTYGVNFDLHYTVLRYGNVYGPRQNPHGEAGVIAIFTGRMLAGSPVTIFGSGDAVRDYVFVGDVVRANMQALTRADRDIVNIGTGVGTSVNELARLLAEATEYPLTPTHAPERLGEVQTIYLNVAHAAEVLDWRPEVNIADGIRRTVEYQKAYEKRASADRS
ncbi:MAG TPA: NAD-dependent epimerase/dehydratase family protein [Armatimonadota bacterium]|jgi:UDP-glucose 4-epimerase